MTRSARFAPLALAALGALFAGVAPAVAAEIDDERSSYSYVRTLEGRATLASAGRGPGEEATLHQPLMQGDVVRVERGARVEVALADRNLVRVAGDTTLVLSRVAFSADRDDRTTRLDLEEGEILLLVTDEALGDELPEVRTPAGRVFIHQPGVYRLRVAAGGELELVVRSGYAELLTERGSSIVRAGEEAWTLGDRWASIEIGPAGGADALERWSDEIDRQVQVARNRTLYVEPQFAYAAAPLASHGSWIYVDSTWCWRPRVTVDWRPYWNGRWAWTPSGMTWVSYEPWGWLPYHYGTWTMVPRHGWVWRPGRVYSPAWVYWYVGPSWTGWCPIGYYADFYRSRWHHGFRFGLYGWTGGSWGLYADWNFCPTPRIFDHDRRWRHTGTHVGRLAGNHGPRGILTTDTRHLARRDWVEAGNGIVEKVVRGAGAYRVEKLAEVTDFVARKPNLPPDVEAAVVVDRARTVRRVDTPLGAATARGSSGKDGVDREADGVPANAWRDRTAGKTGSDDPRIVGGRGRSAASPFPAPPTTGAGARRVAPEPNGRPVSPAAPRAGGNRDDEAGVREPGQAGGVRVVRPTGRPESPAIDPGDRQGWRRDEPRNLGGGIHRVPPAAQPRAGSPSSDDRRGSPYEDAGGRPTYRRPDTGGTSPGIAEPKPGEPVRRVIGGVRRGAPAERPTTSPAEPPAPRSAPRVLPRTPPSREDDGAPPAWQSRGSTAPSGRSVGSAPDRSPRASAPPSAPSPRYVPTPRSMPSPRVVTPSPRATPAPRATTPSTGRAPSAAPTTRSPSSSSSTGSKGTTTRGGNSSQSSGGGKSQAADPPRSSRSKSGNGKRGDHR